MENEGKINHSIFFFFYTIDYNPLWVYTKFEDFNSHRTQEMCDENFHWKERKMDK